MAHVDETDHVAVKSEDIKIEVKTDPDVSNTDLIHDNFRNTTKSELNNSNETDNSTVLDSENLRNNRVESDLKPIVNFFENNAILKTEKEVFSDKQDNPDVQNDEKDLKPIVHLFVHNAIFKSEETKDSFEGNYEKATEAAQMCGGTGPVITDVRSLCEQSKFKLSFFPHVKHLQS